MNIWILNHHAREEGRHPSIAKYLSEEGVDVTLYSSSFLHNTFEETKSFNKNTTFLIENKEQYKRVYIKTPAYKGNGIKRLINQVSFAYRAFKAGKYIGKADKKPDVIIGSSVHLFTGLAAYFLSKKLKASFVFEIRDLWPQTLIDLGALKEKSPITKVFKMIEKFLYKKADMIISVLPNAHDYITKLNIPAEKIKYIPNGIDLNYYNESISKGFIAEEAIGFFNENEEKFIVTFAGSHGIANGLDTVVKAARELLETEKDDEYKTQILLIGDGPEKVNLRKMAKEYKLDNLTFLNKIDRSQVPHVLKKSNLCLFHLNDTPVFNYGLSSNKLFDYMISGKPMLFAVETSYNFAKEAGNGIGIGSENPKAMAEAIYELKNKSKSDLDLMGESGINFVKENHDLRVLASHLLLSLSKLFNDKK